MRGKSGDLFNHPRKPAFHLLQPLDLGKRKAHLLAFSLKSAHFWVALEAPHERALQNRA
jgi:hypothetical protein